MTDAAYPFKSLDQARAVREARRRVNNEWRMNNLNAVEALMPQVAIDAGHNTDDWVISVETQRRNWETPEAAAERVALWITLHAERWGKVPTELAIQRTATYEAVAWDPETLEYEPIATQQEIASAPWTRRDRH